MDDGGVVKSYPASAADHRRLCRRLSGNPSVSGRQWPPVTRADDAVVAQGRVCLGALQLARKCHRAEQGHLLLGAAPNAKDHALEKTGLAAVGHVFTARAPAAKAPPGVQSGAREENSRTAS